MNIKPLVDRGLAIRAQMKELKEELDVIEAKLEKAGLDGEHKELKDADREGRRFLAQGTEWLVPVIFTADKIIASFKANSDVHRRIAQAAGRQLATFYRPTTTYENCFKDGKQFRAAADETLGNTGPALITACLARDKHGLPKSDVKIGWDDAEEVKP